ncbi:hypothetical protein [Paraconexibacter algicola]|uniref:hypothetical protein n=1 Tax=Paraconexibacter algicola TaxID=2133960 RepID=UPI0011B2397E|nr:hypothetical protein [Paraconexibacter algicola]
MATPPGTATTLRRSQGPVKDFFRPRPTLLISEQPLQEGTDAGLDAVLASSAPHLSGAEHRDLAGAYLGNITWRDACAAVGLDPASLPDTTADLKNPS